MYKHAIFILTMVLSLSFACQGLASTRDGDRNFERAWRVFTSDQIDKAVGYFKTASQEYGQALQEDPLSRTMRFPSTQIKAGISSYYAGDYTQCLKVMKLTSRKNKRIWEADLFSALAHARKGEQDAALESLNMFLDDASSQRIISNAILSQLSGMQEGSIPLVKGMELIEQSVQKQFIQNITRNNGQPNSPKEECNGQYWWRMNAAPCSSGFYEF